MKTLQSITAADLSDLVALVTHKTDTNRSMIRPFAEFTPFLTGLLKKLYRPGCRLLAAGHVEPEVELAANNADIELIESIGPSPFSGTLQAVMQNISSPRDIVYVANPNRVTGSNFSLEDLRTLAAAVPEGAIIIDEYYFDFFGITGLSLIEAFPRVILLRSFASAYSIRSSDSGYAITNPTLAASMKDIAPEDAFTPTIRKVIFMSLTSDEAMTLRLREVHEESLRVASTLTRMGAQTRITATDFLLIRVADPVQVGNQLARAKVAVDNLDGYPSMQHYIRYRVQSPLSNDKLIQAFEAMPVEAYRMKSHDNRTVTLRMKAHAADSGAAPRKGSDHIAERHRFSFAEFDTEEEEMAK